jgi:hypothetical protein
MMENVSATPVARWVEIAKVVFPDDAEISYPPNGESVWLRVRWRVKSDPRRPHKLARGVNIYFTREFCKAYQGLEPPLQADWDTKVKDLVSTRFATFNPDHNAPHGAPLPAEAWFITPSAIK